MQAIRKDLERMQALASFTAEGVFPRGHCRVEPTPIDCRVTLYPGPQWIKNTKVDSMLHNIIEQRLGNRAANVTSGNST